MDRSISINTLIDRLEKNLIIAINGSFGTFDKDCSANIIHEFLSLSTNNKLTKVYTYDEFYNDFINKTLKNTNIQNEDYYMIISAEFLDIRRFTELVNCINELRKNDKLRESKIKIIISINFDLQQFREQKLQGSAFPFNEGNTLFYSSSIKFDFYDKKRIHKTHSKYKNIDVNQFDEMWNVAERYSNHEPGIQAELLEEFSQNYSDDCEYYLRYDLVPRFINHHYNIINLKKMMKLYDINNIGRIISSYKVNGKIEIDNLKRFSFFKYYRRRRDSGIFIISNYFSSYMLNNLLIIDNHIEEKRPLYSPYLENILPFKDTNNKFYYNFSLLVNIESQIKHLLDNVNKNYSSIMNYLPVDFDGFNIPDKKNNIAFSNQVADNIEQFNFIEKEFSLLQMYNKKNVKKIIDTIKNKTETIYTWAKTEYNLEQQPMIFMPNIKKISINTPKSIFKATEQSLTFDFSDDEKLESSPIEVLTMSQLSLLRNNINNLWIFNNDLIIESKERYNEIAITIENQIKLRQDRITENKNDEPNERDAQTLTSNMEELGEFENYWKIHIFDKIKTLDSIMLTQAELKKELHESIKTDKNVIIDEDLKMLEIESTNFFLYFTKHRREHKYLFLFLIIDDKNKITDTLKIVHDNKSLKKSMLYKLVNKGIANTNTYESDNLDYNQLKLINYENSLNHIGSEETINLIRKYRNRFAHPTKLSKETLEDLDRLIINYYDEISAL